MDLSILKRLLKTYIVGDFPYSEICFTCNEEDCCPSYEECEKRVKFEENKTAKK